MPPKKQISIRGETKDRAQEEAKRQGITLSEFVDGLCCRYLKELEIQRTLPPMVERTKPLDPATVPSKIRGVDGD